jgi:hypothetical protein
MSVPYVLYSSKIDTSSLNLTSRLAGKLNTTNSVSLSNRIILVYSLSDTSSLNLTSRLATKLNTSDTINMLSNYLRKSDALIIELQNQML